MGKGRSGIKAPKPRAGPISVGYSDEFPSRLYDYLQCLPAADNDEPPTKRRQINQHQPCRSITVCTAEIKLSRRCGPASMQNPDISRHIEGGLTLALRTYNRQHDGVALAVPAQMNILHLYAQGRSKLDEALNFIIRLGPKDDVDASLPGILELCPVNRLKTDEEGAFWNSVNLKLERRGQSMHMTLRLGLHWNETLSLPATQLGGPERRIVDRVLTTFYPSPSRGVRDAEAGKWSPLDFYDAAHVPSDDSDDALSIEIPALESTLYPYQKRTLQWLLNREGVCWVPGSNGSPDAIQSLPPAEPPTRPDLFREARDANGKLFYVSDLYNLITTDPSPFVKAEGDVRGGILAEEMGLGKTLEIIGLILLHCRLTSPAKADSDSLRTTGATLIVTPQSLLPQWLSELQRHAPDLRVLRYDGCRNGKAVSEEAERQLVDELAAHDVVITTYSVLTSEVHFAGPPPSRSMRFERKHHRPKSPLVQLNWWRVCLDEAQMIESGVTAAASVARMIPRVNAWGITGTPVRNDVADLLGLLQFLRYQPYAHHPQIWQTLVKSHKSIFYELFGRISLRHTKRMVRDQIALPAQKRFVISLPFTAVEETFYQDMFQSMATACGLDVNGAPLAEDWDPEAYEDTMRRWLNRLRRTALHPEVALRNQRAVGREVGPIRTVDQVLDIMIDQSEAAIRVDQSALFNAKLTRGQLLENSPRVKQALAIWEEVREEITAIAEDCRKNLKGAIEEAKKAAAEGSASKPSAESNASDDEADEFAGSARVGECRRRLRLALEIQHKAVFFCASAYFQIKDNKDMTNPDSEEFKRLQKLEEDEYERAKAIRREILHETHRIATRYMDKLSGRAANQTFADIPELEGCKLKGIESRPIIDKLDVLYAALNVQANQMDEWREHLIQLLTEPLVDEDDSVELTGEEFTDSIKIQEELIVYVEVLRACIADRQDAISGQVNELVRHEMKVAEQQARNGEGHAPELREKLVKIRKKMKPDRELGSLRGAIGELRALNVKHGRGTESGSSRAEMEYSIVSQQMKATQAQQTAQDKASKDMELEIDLFTAAMNARVEYYRQLQAISDSVSPYEGPKALDVMLVLEDSETNLRKKLETAESKHRYLLNLKESGSKSNEPRLCVICQTTFTTGVLTVCGHQFCKECIMLWFKTHHNCPICKRHLRAQNLHDITIKPQEVKVREEANLSANPMQRRSSSKKTAIYTEFSEEKLAEIQNIEIRPPGFTTKVDALVRHILWLRESDPGSKSIIFSQYKDFLNVLAVAFDRHRIGYTSIDKAHGITKFKEDAGTECFLLHARAHSSGLNLVNASHVFLCEPIVNTALELQAIARVDRIGQEHETTVWLYVVQGTVEESIYNLSVQRRMEHMGRRDKGKSKESTPELLDASIEDANTLEMEQAALAKLMSKDRSAGEMVETNDLWECLFGHVARSRREEASAAAVGAAAAADERAQNPAVIGFLAAEAAERRRDGARA